ncbi:MAG: M20/M25/M40 family metallo-hydrolase [Chloroflexi bacterium]|nr:M20/M25/M40 family metallo-hydrolase [Chloroflexota bacterium]
MSALMDYIRILTDLISIDTSAPPGLNYDQAMKYLDPLFQEAGCNTEIIEIPAIHCGGLSGRMNLIAHRRNPGKPRLVFYSHVDVVPATGWPAFSPRVSEGRVFGRGAADMKGAIPALLMALDNVRGSELAFDVSAIVTTDEEVGQAGQVRYLAQFLQPLKGGYVHSLDSDFGAISITNLGAIHLEVRIKGKSVHSGLSHLGVNAVEKAHAVLGALLSLKEKVETRESAIAANPATGLKYMAARLNVNMIRGGLKSNIIPDECTIAVDRRLIPEENLADAEKELIGAIETVRGVDWEITTLEGIPTVPPCTDPITDRVSEIVREVTGNSGKFGEMGSGDFLPIVANDWQAQLFGLGVIRSDCNIHGKDEFVYQKDIEDLSRIITRFLIEG